MGILLGFGYVELLLVERREIFAEGIVDILLVEYDVHASERRVVRCHAVVLQTGDGGHARFRNVVLCERYGELLGAVVAVVEEYYRVALFYCAVDGRVVDRFYELVGYIGVIRSLHCCNHVGGLCTLAMHEQVVGNFHALPALVAVHGIVATDDRCYHTCRFAAVLLKLFDKSFAAAGVGVTAVHEAMDIYLFKSVALCDVAQGEEVVERGVHTAVRCQTHEVDRLTVIAGV